MSEPDVEVEGGQGSQRRLVVLIAVAAVITLVGLGAWVTMRGSDQDTALAIRRAQVERRGATVMPFDQDRTTHVFDATPDGGMQSVTANDLTDETEIWLVREHLRKEAERFAAGDFDDPAAIHGMEMPGLAELRAGATRIRVRYTQLHDGGRITYTTDDPALVTALHDWFDAQLMDHGTHAHS